MVTQYMSSHSTSVLLDVPRGRGQSSLAAARDETGLYLINACESSQILCIIGFPHGIVGAFMCHFMPDLSVYPPAGQAE